MKKRELNILIGAILFVIAFILNKNIDMKIISTILFALSYIITGKNVLIKAYKNMKKGSFFDENFLMTIATIGAIIIGEYPEAVGVMLFYEVGEFFQGYAVSKSRKSIADLMDIKPEYANLIKNNIVERVEPDDVKLGEIIEVRAGEKVPLDGIVIKGEGAVDTSALTGESIPREIKVNDQILSGCINLNGLLLVKVTKEYYDSTVSKILELVEESAVRKSKSERFITKFSKIYTPIVVVLAVLLAIIPPLVTGNKDFSVWVYRALSFLVVSCPCAFVLSVPLAFFGGIGAASTTGILVKGGNYLEFLANVDSIVFDKTGTLTKGVFNVQEIFVEDKTISEEEFIELVAYAESGSNHPISKSIQRYYAKEIDKNKISYINEISGKGIEARINNKNILIGNDKLVSIPRNFELDKIGTVLYVAIDNKYAGYILIADEIKAEAKSALQKLKDMGIKNLTMLTGDNEKIAKKVSAELGIDDVYSNLLPADKVNLFESIMAKKKNNVNTIFIGDGINDAPVLARADVGMAMGAMGSDAAIEAADVVIMTDDLSKIPLSINIAKKTLKIAMQNIAIAFLIKVVALILVSFGMASMWEAVFADVGVTILAVLNSFRVLKVDKK